MSNECLETDTTHKMHKERQSGMGVKCTKRERERERDRKRKRKRKRERKKESYGKD